MRASLKTVLAVWIITGGQAAARAQTAGLPPTTNITLNEAIRRAEANEPAFAVAAAEQRATTLERKDARAALLPSASYHNQFLLTESNKSQAATKQGGYNQSLPVFIANNAVHEYYTQGVVNETVGFAGVAAVRLADAAAAVASAELEIVRRGLVATVVNLYYSVSAGDERVAIARRALGEADRFVDVTQKREAGREAAHADVIKAQLQQQQRQRELIDAKVAASKAQLELGVLLFPDPASVYSLAATEVPPLLPERASVDSAARANNPELRSALANLQVSQAQTSTAQAALLPVLGLNFAYGLDAPQLARNGPDGARNLGYSASATLDIPLWDWLTTERKVKEAHIRGDVAKVAVSATQRRLVADLAEFYAEADVAQQQLASLDGSVVTARESLRLTNLRYVDGESTVLDVVDAQNTLISQETARAEGIVRYELALAQLQTLTGRL